MYSMSDGWKNPWQETDRFPWPPSDSQNAGNAPAEELSVIEDAVREALRAVAENAGERPVLLHIGVGVGDPSGTLKNLDNRTGGLQPSVVDHQVNPPFLADAASKNYYVVALNFNHADDSTPIRGFPRTSGIHLQVPACFPLSADRQDNQRVWDVLAPLLGKAARVAVMNSVSQLHYQGLVDFINLSSQKVGRYNVAYIHYAYGTDALVVGVASRASLVHKTSTVPVDVRDLFVMDVAGTQ